MSFWKNQLDVILTRFFHNLALYQNVKQCIIDNDRELLLTQTNRLKQTFFYQISQSLLAPRLVESWFPDMNYEELFKYCT